MDGPCLENGEEPFPHDCFLTWFRTGEKERRKMGFGTWNEARIGAAHRTSWRGLICHCLILYEDRRDKVRLGSAKMPVLSPVNFPSELVSIFT